MKLAFGLAVLAVLVPGGWMACKTLDELDVCANEISFLENRDAKVPTNDAEVLELCGKAKAGVTCLKDQGNECMNGPMKSVTLKILGDLMHHLNTRCDSAPHRAEFLKHVACFTDNAKAEAVRLCSDKHLVMMEKVSNMPAANRLGGGCCSAIALKDCVISKVTELCSGETGDYFNDMIQEVAEENMSIVCNEYGTMDQCNKYSAWPELKAIMDSTDPNIAKGHKYKTVIPIIIKMMKEAK